MWIYLVPSESIIQTLLNENLWWGIYNILKNNSNGGQPQ